MFVCLLRVIIAINIKLLVLSDILIADTFYIVSINLEWVFGNFFPKGLKNGMIYLMEIRHYIIN